MASLERSIPKNYIWHSLVGEHRHLALGSRRARCYHPEVSPFAALQENDSESLKDLASLVSPGDLVLLRDDVPDHQGEWRHETETLAVQMILPSGTRAFPQAGLRQLTVDDVPSMLELTQLVLPGYLRKRGIEMGSFFGIFDGSKLIAMTGERVFPHPHREITAVCTHPDYQRRGYAAQLVEHVVALMFEAGHMPFLHTSVGNTRAIALYNRLGFKENGIVPLNGMRRL